MDVGALRPPEGTAPVPAAMSKSPPGKRDAIKVEEIKKQRRGDMLSALKRNAMAMDVFVLQDSPCAGVAMDGGRISKIA